jgi:chaperone LolA
MQSLHWKNILLASLILSTGVHPAGAASGDETASDVLRQVKEKYDEIRDAKLRFSQKVAFERTGIEQSARGDLWMEKGNRYRLEMNDRTVVTNGSTVWSYSAGAGQVIVDEFRLDESDLSPERILTGGPDEFNASHLGKDDEGLIVLKLLPREENTAITSLKLWIDEDTWFIRKAEVSEFGGKRTEYRVEELKTNVGLDEDVFHFAIPEGVEVVDLR